MAEALFLDFPECRPRTSAGRGELVVATSIHVTRVQTVVLASYGTRLTGLVMSVLETHLSTVCSESHVDVTVIRIDLAV